MSWFHLEKNQWPRNSPDLRQVDYRVGPDAVTLSEIHAKTVQQFDELKTALLSIGNDLPQEFIDKAVGDFTFWLSPWLSLLVEPKSRLSRR